MVGLGVGLIFGYGLAKASDALSDKDASYRFIPISEIEERIKSTDSKMYQERNLKLVKDDIKLVGMGVFKESGFIRKYVNKYNATKFQAYNVWDSYRRDQYVVPAN